MRLHEGYFFLTLLAIVCTLASCKRKPIAEIIETYKTGILKEERYYNDEKDKTSYTSIIYYENGDTSETIQYRKGEKDGFKIGFTHWGRIKSRVHYVQGFKVDTIFSYSDSGVITQMQIIKGKCPDTLCCCDGVHLNFGSGKLQEKFMMKDKSDDGIHET